MLPAARTRFGPRQIDRDAVERARTLARDAGIDLDRPSAAEVVEWLAAAAPAVLPVLLRDPALVRVLGGEIETQATVLPARVPPAREVGADVEEVKRRLRRLRGEALVRTALREVRALADVDQTAREWSHAAGDLVAHALAAAEAIVEARNGPPVDEAGRRVPFVVLGMGKLGGEELNLGSDIDVCYFYGTDEGSAGARTLHEHFARVATVLTDLLHDVTAAGFAFRVDLRLRPEGSRGPIANSLASAERYYETWGRTWERAALLRARPVAGDVAFGRYLLDALRPFVFRRAVDPHVAVEIAEMLERARREQLRDDARDLKLGRGGIREVEFFVQALQLVWGGRHSPLQVPGTLPALRALRALGFVSHRDARDLDDAWGLLRRVEHRVQVIAPYATHELPDDFHRLDALAGSLGYTSRDELLDALASARARVSALFATLFPHERPPAAPSPESVLADVVASGVSPAEVLPRAVEVLGVRNPDDAADDLFRLASRADFPLGAVARDRFPHLGARLLAEVRDAPDPDLALGHLAELFRRVRPADHYLRLLAEQPARARGLVGLFGASETLSRTLLARPELIDLFVGIDRRAPEPAEVFALVASAARGPGGDPDAVVGALRKITRELTLAVGLADVAGELGTLDVTLRLTALAEANVVACLSLAAEECAQRFGTPGGGAPSDGIAVFGLGSMAARELGHGGDLDLLFVYDAEGTTAGGARPGVTAGEYAVRVAQRTLSLLSMPHEEGPGYATDTRLRPSGSHGTLVTSREAFARYHATSAPWERQALIRARPVAGDERLGATVRALMETFAYERGAPDVGELQRLRARMEMELGREDRGEVAVKYGRGGLVDVEFAVQALQMARGTDRGVRTPNTCEAIEALRAGAYLPAPLADALREGERLLRAMLLAVRLTTLRGALVPSAPSALTVARRLGYRDRAGATALEELLADLATTRARVRHVFREVMTLLPH